MLLPWLFLLLSAIPEPLPPLADLAMFPGQEECRRQQERLKCQRETAAIRYTLAQNERERDCWSTERERLNSELSLWEELLQVHQWADPEHAAWARWYADFELPAPYVARKALRDLRDSIGAFNYYHGQVRYPE